MFLLSVLSTESKNETNSLRSLRLSGDYKLSNKPVPSTRYQVPLNGQRKVIFSKKDVEWPLKKRADLEILNECLYYNEERLPEFYKRMGFPVSKN